MGEQLAAQFVTTHEASLILNATDTSLRAWWREGLLSDPLLVGKKLYLWSRAEIVALKAKRDAARA